MSLVKHLMMVVVFGSLVLAGAGEAVLADAKTTEGTSDWQFQISPYLWFASIEGDVATLPSLPTASVEAGFGDIFSSLNIGLMLAAEARREKFGLHADLIYMDLSLDGDTPGPGFSDVDLDVMEIVGTVAASYRPLDRARLTIDVLAGARIWVVDTEVRFRAGLLPAVSTSHTEIWADPVVGVRIHAPLGTRFYLAGYGDVGGGGIASDHTFQLYGGVGYKFKDWFSAELGYRYLEVDYKDDGFVYDVSMHGLTLGARFRF